MRVRVNKAGQHHSPSGINHLIIRAYERLYLAPCAYAFKTPVAHDEGAVIDDGNPAHLVAHSGTTRPPERDKLRAIYDGEHRKSL
jgi:hypothetical protein